MGNVNGRDDRQAAREPAADSRHTTAFNRHPPRHPGPFERETRFPELPTSVLGIVSASADEAEEADEAGGYRPTIGLGAETLPRRCGKPG